MNDYIKRETISHDTQGLKYTINRMNVLTYNNEKREGNYYEWLEGKDLKLEPVKFKEKLYNPDACIIERNVKGEIVSILKVPRYEQPTSKRLKDMSHEERLDDVADNLIEK